MKTLSNEAVTFLLALVLEKLDQRDLAEGEPSFIAELRAVCWPNVTAQPSKSPVQLAPDHARELLDWLLAHQAPVTAAPRTDLREGPLNS